MLVAARAAAVSCSFFAHPISLADNSQEDIFSNEQPSTTYISTVVRKRLVLFVVIFTFPFNIQIHLA